MPWPAARLPCWRPKGRPGRPACRRARCCAPPSPREKLAQFAVELAGKLPERLAAVTGTNGKTSTVDFIRQILCLAGRRAASLGTLGVIAEGVPAAASLTTPDPVTLANTLAMLAREGFSDAALEASSHGIEQSRLDGLSFAAAGFTNLTRDHLDYHGSMEAYRAAKLRLFGRLVKRGAAARAMADLDPVTLGMLREIALEARPGVSGAQLRADRGTAVRPGDQGRGAGGVAAFAGQIPGR